MCSIDTGLQEGAVGHRSDFFPRIVAVMLIDSLLSQCSFNETKENTGEFKPIQGSTGKIVTVVVLLIVSTQLMSTVHVALDCVPIWLLEINSEAETYSCGHYFGHRGCCPVHGCGIAAHTYVGEEGENMAIFIEALTQINAIYLLAIILGTVAGYVIGALPGFSATMGVAIFVPFSYGMHINVAFGFLIALYCSAVFAGSIPAIMIRTPGTPAAICTIYDGYPMALKGEAGRPWAWHALHRLSVDSFRQWSSFSAQAQSPGLQSPSGTLNTSCSVLGLTMVISMSGDNLIKGFIPWL